MQNEYSSRAKRTNNGKKITYEVLKDGQPFGSRNTGRVYTVALVAKHSRAYSLQNARENIAYYKKSDAWKPEEKAQHIAKYEEHIANLLAVKPDPHFDIPFVASWHGSRASARVPKYLEFVAYVDLVQPEASV